VSLAKVCFSPLEFGYQVIFDYQLVAHYCGKTLAKDFVRTSDWESTLTPRQRVCTKPVHNFMERKSILMQCRCCERCTCVIDGVQ